MTVKNFFKKKAQKAAQQPREMPDIQKEYTELSARAAQSQYLVFVHTKDLEQVNSRLMAINQEAGARQQLDKANTPQPPVEGNTQVQQNG